MGLLDAIKELYYNGEDRYYHFLDSLDAKGIPVYRIVEPIDKVFPSFALFLIIISILIIALVWFLVTIFFITTVPLSVLVVDSQQNPLPNITVLVEFGDQTVTGTTGVDGKTAPFGIPQNSRAKIVIDRDGFEHFESESFLVETEQTKTVVLLPEGVGPGPGLGEGIPRTIRIVNQQGSPIIGENIHLVFSCINTNITPPQSVTVTSGSVQVIEPPGCNGLIARVTSDSYLTIDSQPIFNDPQSIFLTATQINVDKGNLQVTVLENGVPVTDSIVVVLYDAAGAFSLTQAATVEGVVLFQDLDPGTYKVQTVATDIFGSVSQSNVAVISNQTMSINLSVTASTVGAIKIKVVAEGTNKVIENASVVLLYEDIEIGRQLTSQDSNGFVTFYVSEDVEYDVTVDAKNYCLETRSDIRLSPGSYIVELEPYTASCGGPLLVQVVDQAGKAVSNASVTLANEEHFFLGTAHHLSDLNGMARFTGMPSGTYSAFAYKGTVSGWSDAIFFNKKAGATESIDLTVTMQIPNGILRINVVDKEGQPIPFAQVFFIDTSNNETFGGGARPTDGQGILEFETRADKKVFLIVQKQGFASFVSPEYNILPSTIQEVTIELLPPITKFEIELLGLYQGNLFAPVSSNRSVSLTNGQEYLAKFRVKIPEENSSGSNKANEAGIHLRTGDDTIIEKDLLFLKQTNIPQASIIRSTSFTEDISVDSAAITEGDAKWVNAVWENPLGSVIEADVIIKIKPTAALGEKLSVWYRSWMRVGSSNTKDPVDQSGSDHELYSDAKLARYTVGIGTLCDDTFCFETSIFDPETELNHFLENNFFHAQTKHNYTLTFSIANISERDIDSFRNAELRVKNPEESLLLREYTIFDADPQGSTPIIGVADDYKMPNIDVGDLSPGRQVTGNIAFFTEKLKSGRIVLEIVDTDRKEIVFSREVQILVAADKQLAIRVEPDLLVAGIENDVIFTVTDKDTEEPIENAVVNIRDRFETLLKSSITNSLGKVEMTLPGQAPGEKLFGIAEKPDYNSARVELSVDTDIAEVAPPTIGFGLNSQTQPSDTRIITITNLADFPLIVHAIKINGKFYGLIDEEAMENAIAAFEGTTIAPDSDLEVPITLQVSNNASQLTEPANLNGLVTVELTNFGQVWLYDVGLTAYIGLGGEVDDPSCLSISKTQWITSTEGKPVSVRFEIQNNCSVNGQPVAIQEVEAKLQWESNPTGNFELTSSKSHSMLRTGYYKTVLPKLGPEESETVTLQFTPYGGVIGESHARILFQATNPSDSAPQILQAELEAIIEIVNLLDCIAISKNYLEMTAEMVFAPQTTGFGQIYNQELFDGDFEDTDFSGSMGFSGGMGASPFFNNNLYSGYNPTNFNYGSQPGFSPAYGGSGFNSYEYGSGYTPGYDSAYNPAALPSSQNPVTGNQLLGMQNTGFLPTGASQPPTDSFTIQTNACGGPVTITLESELRLSTKRIQLSGDETSEPIIAFGEENFLGQYGIKLSIQGGGAKNPRQIRTIPVVIHSNPFDCIQMNKFEFNIFKESENSGIDTARVYNYCFDKPVPVLIDQHDLHDALKHGQKTAALGLAMGLMSQLMKGDLLNKIKNPDQEKDKTEDDKKEDKKEETDCDPMPKGADCKGLQIIKKEDGSLKQLPIYKLGSSYFAREGTTIIEVIKEGDKYVPITPPPATPPANPPTDTQPAETASNQTLLPSTTGFQIFGLPYVPESEGYEQTGNPEIDEERRDDAQELADLQLLPTMIGMMGGGNDPFSMALMMYSMGAIQAYASQEDVRYMTIQPDLELGGGILGFLGGGGDMFGFDLGGGIGDALGGIGGFLDSILPFDRQAFSLLKIPAVFESDVFDGINVSEYRRPTFAPRRDNQALSTETAYIKIENTDAVIQEDPLNPLFAVLNVNGTRHIYDRDQAYEEEMPNSLREEGSYKINAKFHLQLNSFKPDTDRGFISNELANCKIGALVGSTGPEAVPRIKLSWNWNEIPINLCDNDNPEYSYCDATQFSIALLQKLQKLREFITVNADTFECPALVSGETVIEQTLSTTAQDIGLTKLEYRKEGNDINFLTTISSNNQLEFNTIVTTTIQETDDNGIPTETVHSCDTPATVLTSQTVSCLAPELENGAYLVTSTLGTITDCQECRNDNTSNDVIFKTMLIGLDQTIVQCDPIETSRLQAFIEATEQSGESITYPQGLNKESTLKLVNFTAHLIKDGFTQDFRNDFDEFASSKAFFQTPAYYSQEDGLGEYFTDPNHFSFEYFGAPSGPIIGPGVYQVQVNIKFEDMGFVWFEGGQPVATIEVSLDKTADASPTSPFYYLPFDGLIGVDNGRNGYGLNYELLTADKPVRINKQVDQLIQLNNILGSNPAGVLKGLFVDDFKSTNHDARGQVMSIDRSTNELKLTPSLATPIVLQVNATSARDAYAFYRTESRGQPQKDFDYLATWNGLGATCKDYYGNDMDIYTEMPDKSGTDAICAIVGSQADTAFGFEWCDKITSGNLYLETILYSPATSSSTLNLIAASNSAKLISKGANGDQIELSGVSGITYNTASNPIGAVEDVLALVKDELVCVSGLDNSQRTEFFWNPKPVLESIQNERDQALETCITG